MSKTRMERSGSYNINSMKIRLFSTLILGIIFISVPLVTEAHRSGCHRWHSCPSDTGSYTCGDLGYTSGCPSRSDSNTVAPAPAPIKNQPANSYISGSNWYCNNGYKKIGNQCEKVQNPLNSYVSGASWYCNNGYKKVGTSCEKIINPINSYVSGSSWYCNNGYKKVAEQCVKVVNPPNSYVSGSSWYCNNGYKKIESACKKIINPPNSYISGSNWYCNSGYKKINNQCVSIFAE